MSLSGWSKPELRWLELTFDRELDEVGAERLLLALITRKQPGRVALEIEGRQRQIRFRLGSLYPNAARNLIKTFLPGLIVRPLAQNERSIAKSSEGRAWRLTTSTSDRPISSDDPHAFSRQLMAAITSGYQAGSRIIHQVVIGSHLNPSVVPSVLTQRPTSSWVQAASDLFIGGGQLDPESRKALTAKRGQHGCKASIRLLILNTDDTQSVDGTLRRYRSALAKLEAPGVGIGLHRDRWHRAANAEISRPISVNVKELGALRSWPLGDEAYPGLNRSGSRSLPPVGVAETGRILGTSTHAGQEQSLALSVADGLRHLRILGPTGVGKSTLMLNLILQDISSGRGVVVMDPKGDLVNDVLARVPSADMNRVVVLDPARPDFTVSFNPLAVERSEGELAVDGIMHVFAALNKDGLGPRSTDILHSALLTVVASEHASLTIVPRLLRDAGFRGSLLRTQPLSPALRSFWAWFDALSEAERGSATAPLMNKLRPFLLRSSLNAMLSDQSPKFDPSTIFTENRVLLVPLRRGQIGSGTANLLGSLVLARIWQIAQGQSRLPEAKRRPVFLYLDEFQDYLRLPTDLSDVLAQSRSLGLGLVLAHQHLAQLNPDVRSSVASNAQNSVVFRLGQADAAVIAKGTPVLTPDDLMALGPYETYSRLLRGGRLAPTVSMRTLPPLQRVRNPQEAARKIAGTWGVKVSAQASQAGDEPLENKKTQIGKRKRSASQSDGSTL